MQEIKSRLNCGETNLYSKVALLHYIISMILCGDSINKPLAAIFKNSFNAKIFPNDWEKENVVPTLKKKF